MKTMTDHEKEITDRWRERKRKQWRWKSPKLQEQSHPSTVATGVFKGHVKAHVAVQYTLSVQLTG